MIGYIKGKATVVSKEFCFIEAGGIGYRVFISEMSRQKIHLGTPVRLLTYMAVREDAILLYGFLTQEEYDLFLILISVFSDGAGGFCFEYPEQKFISFNKAARCGQENG